MEPGCGPLLGMIPVLINLPTPILNEEHGDVLQWRMRDGTFISFSVRDAWNSVRERGNEVDWYHFGLVSF